MATWEVREGDALERLRGLPAESVQCCVTSPPYFGLRDYGIDGQIGLERSPDEFVARLVDVFRAVRRVLRSDGTLWLNIGDSYASSTVGVNNNGQGASTIGYRADGSYSLGEHGSPYLNALSSQQQSGYKVKHGCKPKDLLGIPWLLAFALRADGWYLRSDVIWAKPNPMPESVTDRPTSAHEHVFLLAKSPRYFYDADAIQEPYETFEHHARYHVARERSGYHNKNGMHGVGGGHTGLSGIDGSSGPNPNGRNKRNVWEVATQPYADAHFATFPPKLIEPCILAGSSPKACGECGAPWERVVERGESSWQRRKDDGDPIRYGLNGNAAPLGRSLSDDADRAAGGFGVPALRRDLGWQPSCDHDDDTGRSVILDPFAGAGTTGLVALRHDRSFIGIELNSSYAEMARERIRQDAPLLNTPAEGETWQPRSLTVPLNSA